jgi:hypothetical protein
LVQERVTVVSVVSVTEGEVGAFGWVVPEAVPEATLSFPEEYTVTRKQYQVAESRPVTEKDVTGGSAVVEFVNALQLVPHPTVS